MTLTQADTGRTRRKRGVVTSLTTAVETIRASQRDRVRVRRVALANSEEARIAAQLQHGQNYRRLAS